MKIILVVLTSLLMSLAALSQGIKGKISDEKTSSGLPGVSILVQGTNNGTVTDANGDFSLNVAEGSYNIVVSFIGYTPKIIPANVRAGETLTLNESLAESSEILSEIVVTGSRSGGRSRIDSPVPVDIIPVSQITNNVGQVDINQILTYIAPSFQSSRQTISDGSDHIDPAQLRGLGPDQVLVLVNGKRRHQSSLVNVNGTVNRGTVGTDLNAIPATAVDKIEILRDGAAAQYGSDAIAGVINIILKTRAGLSGNVSYGQNVTSYDKNYILNSGADESVNVSDGGTAQVGINYGLKIGDKGFVNITGEYVNREATNRTGTYTGQIFPAVNGNVIDDQVMGERGLDRNTFDMRIGNSKVKGGGVVLNANIPVSAKLDVYAFGGYNNKKGNAAGFYRYPNGIPAVVRDNVFAVYPNGFLPEINSDVTDISASAGFRGTIGQWKFDLSNTFGKNDFDYEISNSVNYTQAVTTNNFQTRFKAGGNAFSQNTINLDFGRKFDVLYGLNVALGAEQRTDKYTITAGEEASYKNYDVAAGVAAGAQVFSGFFPQNAGSHSRSSVAGYIDLEQDITKAWVLSAALRFENYSDFGNTLNYKVSTRYKITDRIALRASASTGFRAPSLQQKYYAKTNTLFVTQNGQQVAQESGTFTNDSRPAEILGIPKLKQETSQSFTVGTTIQLNNAFELTVDAYQIDIDDRIVLTNNFSDGGNAALKAQLAAANATTANFFSNAVDTRSRGLEGVLSYNTKVGQNQSLRAVLAGTFIQNKVKKDASGKPIIHASEILEQTGQVNTYFNREDLSRFEIASPKNKQSLTINYKAGKFGIMLRGVRFGEVAYWDPTIDPTKPDTWPVNTLTGQKETLDQTFDAKIVTDVAINYDLVKGFNLSIGANNVFDVYQEKHNHSGNVSLGRFVYSRRVQQMGVNGRYIFARVNFIF
ncbi:TonB-dependent receptor [Dyadobacter psychrophilus]|uniref:Iron complex outermembrane recepter protein n=1 Tax=Dyadobacter psychrophilus TaxID=651661 RepID=A0A1T5GW57_9BACT|nr:TonB-dependent receptor [Dyadobacter psychrophilus]SKC12637.1 iron complex outermembrane recepter protein [Dyadobacter psychrophilus]